MSKDKPDYYVRAKKRWKRKYYKRTAFSENYRQPWTVSELEMIMTHDIPDRQLSEILGRSVNSIQLMRHRQKKSEAADQIQQQMGKVKDGL